jgi:beta-glucosidase
VVDERTQWEMYYPPFQAAVDAGVLAVMCSYNKIQLGGAAEGTFSCENPGSLQRDLKDRMGFGGFVVSDWGATHSVASVCRVPTESTGFKHFLGV